MGIHKKFRTAGRKLAEAGWRIPAFWAFRRTERIAAQLERTDVAPAAMAAQIAGTLGCFRHCYENMPDDPRKAQMVVIADVLLRVQDDVARRRKLSPKYVSTFRQFIRHKQKLIRNAAV